MQYLNSKILQLKSHKLIPGGCHTYAKGDDQYPERAPAFIVRGKGCHVWDVDGNEFIEYGMGLRAVTLGHAYEPVVEAAHRQMMMGTNFTRPAKIELDAAETMLELFKGAEMVKFCKNGSDATTAAVKIARSYTGRDMVAVCGNQPFFSTDDWFIGKTEMNSGIPKATQSLTVTFEYNNLAQLEELFTKFRGQIAGVILEPATSEEPAPGFLQSLKQLCESNGALLIFDEMITGFRWHLGGAQTLYGVVPHLSAFGKAMANGFAVSALVGQREFMHLGGIHHTGERVFVLSTTHGAETHALAAALKTISVYREHDVIQCLEQQGEKLRARVIQSIRENDLDSYFSVIGRASNLIYVTRGPDGSRSQAYRTLFLQETLRQGLIAPSLVVSFSHSDQDIDRTADIIHHALVVYRKALTDGIEQYLEGREVKPVFRRFN